MRALSRPVSRTPLHFQALLASANAEQEFSLVTAISDLCRAIAVADMDSLLPPADRFCARTELAIALFLTDERDAALDAWEDAGAMLLEIDPDDDRAKGRILVHPDDLRFKKAGMSDRGLAKFCERYDIPVPERG